MGYYATFEFDLKIPADVVEEMEREYFRVQQENDAPEFTPGEFCKHFNDQWGDQLASEESPAPLEALAACSTRGDIIILGGVNKKWRDWEESMMESIAEFIESGGTVAISGEDGHRTNWEFNDGSLCVEEEEHIKCSERHELEEKARELEVVKARLVRAEEILRSHLDIFGQVLTSPLLAQEIKTFLDEKHPLENLAECAE